MPIERLAARTMPEAITEVLRRAIFDGTLAPGSQLAEVALATQLGISRAPLREALHRLELEGFVVKVPYRGAFVAEIDRKAADEIARIRLILEPYAVEIGRDALREGPAHDRLMEACHRMLQAAEHGDATESVEAHLEVHRVIYEAGDNSRLAEIWRAWERHLRLFLSADHRSFANLHDVANRHLLLAEVIGTGDRPTIEAELARHIHGSLTTPHGESVATGIEEGDGKHARDRRPAEAGPAS